MPSNELNQRLLFAPSLWTDMLPHLPPEEAVTHIGAAGFTDTEFGITHENRFLEGNPDEEERLQAINQAAQKAEIRISQMHGFMFNPCGPDLENNILRAQRSLRRAAAMGVKWVVLHPGTKTEIADVEERKEITRKQNLLVFRDMLHTAESLGVGIALENMPQKSDWRFAANADDLLWLCDELNSEHAGVCWDTSHASIANVDQPAELRKLGARLHALHISDSDGVADRHWAPLRGSVDWKGIIQALHEIQYQGPFNLEVPGETRHLPAELRILQLPLMAGVCRYILQPAFMQQNG